MDTFEAIEQRRSVKHYDPDHRMSEAEIDRLASAARLAPTSFNMQNWRFVVVTDPELRTAIRAAAWDQAQVSEASVLFILAGDLNAHAKSPERYWADAPPGPRDILVPMIPKFYDGKPELQAAEVHRSCGLAGQTIMLAAKAMGYDSCPMVGFDPAKVAELINLPADHVISYMITVGKALKPAWPRPGTLPTDEVVIRNRFPV